MKTKILTQKNNQFSKILCTFRFNQNKYTPQTSVLMQLYADMLLSGAGGLSRGEFLEKLKAVGSEVSVGVTGERVNLSVISLNKNLPETLSLVQLLIEKPTFAPPELKRVKELNRNKLFLLKENARYQTDRIFSSTMLKKNDARYQFSPDQLIKALAKVTIKEIKHLHHFVLSSEWNVSIGGTSQKSKEARDFFRKLAKKYENDEPVGIPQLGAGELGGNTTVFTELPSKENIEFNIGGLLELTTRDAEYPAFYFGLSVLGLYGGFAGRLMSTVREKEGLTYSINCRLDHVTTSSMGQWRVRTFFTPQQSLRGIKSTLREIKKIRNKGITKDELQRFKSILKTRLILRDDSLLKKLDAAHKRLIHNISEEEREKFNKRIQNLSLPEVNTALKKHLDISKLVISAAGPVSSVKADIQKLFS